MSENKNSCNPYHALLHHDQTKSSEGFAFPIITDLHHNFNPFTMYNHVQPPLQNPSDQFNDHMSFSNCLQGAVEYNTLSAAFDLSCSSHGGADNIPVTPNSSAASFSSQEVAGGEEDSSKSKRDVQPNVCEDGEGRSKNIVYVQF